MPATVRLPPDEPRPAIAAAASPYGLGLRDDRPNLKPRCDLCPDSSETYHLRHMS